MSHHSHNNPHGSVGNVPAFERGQLGSTNNNQYADFPSPLPHSPLKESPLIHYPPIRHYGQIDNGTVKNRGGDFKTSDQVYQPFYQNRISYPPTEDLPNSLAPLNGVALYHSPLSVASMKVRMGLYEKEVQWKSNLMDLYHHDQLAPKYCNINPRATVPTLTVDGRVTTDDKNILNYINKTFPGIDMIPECSEEKDVMDYFIDLVERQNIEAIAYGTIPGVQKKKTSSPYPGRRRKLDDLAHEHHGHHHLAEIYKVKREVTEYQEDIACNPNKMQQVFGNLELCLSEIEYQLSNGPFSFGGWLAAERFTLADIHALCMLYMLDVLDLKYLFGINTLRYYQQGKTRESFTQATDDWMNPCLMALYTLIPNKNHRMALYAGCLLLLLLLLALIGFGLFKLFAWMFAPPIVVKVAPKFTGLREDVLNVVDQSFVEVGKSQDWMKYCLLIFPVMLLVPLFLWFCGCLKCKKRTGRSNGAKARPATLYDDGHTKTRSNSLGSLEDCHSDVDAVVVTRDTKTTVVAQHSNGDMIAVQKETHEATIEADKEKKAFSRSNTESSSLQKIVVVEHV